MRRIRNTPISKNIFVFKMSLRVEGNKIVHIVGHCTTCEFRVVYIAIKWKCVNEYKAGRMVGARGLMTSRWLILAYCVQFVFWKNVQLKKRAHWFYLVPILMVSYFFFFTQILSCKFTKTCQIHGRNSTNLKLSIIF